MSLDRISIRGARQHNLKDIDLEIPRDELVVITGLSGSGKSSLAFDTIYAEGQRRYVESLSAYARQFLGQMDKPDVDHIEGLSPAVSIDQKTTSKNPRSTVGTVTEIYDYLRLLFARVGIPHCPVCGRVIEKQTAEQIVDTVLELPEGTKFQVLAPIVKGRKGEYHKLFEELKAEGFTRVRVDGEVRTLDEEIVLNKKLKHTIDVVLDRLVMKESIRPRLAESVDMALKLADGTVRVAIVDGEEHEYSQALACPEHGFSMDELNPRDFSFNAPYGACPECLGIGNRLEADPDLVVPDHTLSIAEGAIKPYSGNLNYYPQLVEAAAKHIGVSIDVPWAELPEEARHKLLHGFGDEKIRLDYLTRDGRETYWFTKYEGALASVTRRHEETESELSKEKLEEFMAVIPCASCGGARLKPEILAVTVGGKNIHEVTGMSAGQSLRFFEAAELLTEREQIIASRIIKEILERLRFLVDVGLDYLTLERATATLSGGEAQRIRLATQIGSGLVGVLYILDEPSIGLHQRDNERLIAALKRLRDIGNTVIVVEHDEETIREADYVIDMGPGAGEHGGEIVCIGRPDTLLACPDS
ncbi:MAG: excinuclease ABC subunit UvrA, partial [Coriobacteriia bacterium]|nr:excinuclease ABC subunit UvrA [Coriobacteriia bacterium]